MILKILFIFVGVLSAQRAPFREDNRVVIKSGTIIEGTAHQGRTQPHYLADYDNPVFVRMQRQLEQQLRGRNLSYLERIDFVTRFVQSQFTDTTYTGPRYQAQNVEAIAQKKPLALSTCMINRAGVCREHNLVLHHMLRTQGIESQYVTAKVTRKSGLGVHTEDHSFLTFKDPHTGKLLTADAYFDKYHGLDYEGLTKGSVVKGNAASQNIHMSTRDSVFARVRALPEERVGIIGARSYNHIVPPSAIKPDGTLADTVLDAKGEPVKSPHAYTAPASIPSASCRDKILRALHKAL